MPIGYITENKKPEAEALQRRLSQEWRVPNAQGTEPVLIEQASTRGDGAIFVYVIWQDWEAFTQSERTEIIYESYAETHPEHDLLNVTVAMGLTPNEAISRRIFYTTEHTTENAA